MNTLVLNHDYQPVTIVSWERAIYYLVTEKAEALVNYEKVVRSVSKMFAIPGVIRLKKYFKPRRRRAKGFNRSLVFERDRYQCQYCGRQLGSKTATIDHVIPVSKGGKTTYLNTVCCCHDCNGRKSNLTPEAAGLALRRDIGLPKRRLVKKEVYDRYEEFRRDYFGV